ncbi:MAG: hypothetical protein IKT52_10175 [Oscillospiraceae bacterium]|nr:hypothetical protein [Oscillospiraceae bacterium]
MRLQKITCPSCNGTLDMKISDNTEYIFCPYCGTQYFVDDAKKYTFNQNINIKKDIKLDKTIHNRYTNDADVIRAKHEANEYKNAIKLLCFILPVLLVLMLIPSLLLKVNEKAAKAEGKISAGYYKDLLGKDYETVEAHFEAAGFTNIELIDLNDSGLLIWNNGKVETISVGGDTSFESTDFFDPNTKVVISYH